MHRCKSAFSRRGAARWAAAVVLCLAQGAVLAAAPPPANLGSSASDSGTLYEGLGGQVGLGRIVHAMLRNAQADARIRQKFDDIDIGYLERRLTDRLCAWTGGPCQVRGPSMAGAHAELGLTDRHFNALVEDLEAAMDEVGTPFGIQNKLLAMLAPMHRDVVGK